MLVVVCAIAAANWLTRDGWIGGFGQVIGHDYLVFYSTGTLYRTAPERIYDSAAHRALQQSLVAPTALPAVNPNVNPPWAAMAFSLLTWAPFGASFALWELLCVAFAAWSIHMSMRLIPEPLVAAGLTQKELVIVTLSFFPFVEGWIVGQNHVLSMLLVSGIVVSMFADRWALAGVLGGLTLYKPQYVVGFAILWLVWGRFRALAAFAAVAIAWIGSFLWLHGVDPFREFLRVSAESMQLPYNPGFPAYLLLTPYGFLTTTLPQSAWPVISTLTTAAALAFTGGLAWFGFRLRHRTVSECAPAIVLACFLPLVTSPYALLHDLLVIVPGFLVWSRFADPRRLLAIASGTYLCAFFVPLLAFHTKIAWMALITIALVAEQIRWIVAHRGRFAPVRPPIAAGAESGSA